MRLNYRGSETWLVLIGDAFGTPRPSLINEKGQRWGERCGACRVATWVKRQDGAFETDVITLAAIIRSQCCSNTHHRYPSLSYSRLCQLRDRR